MTFADSNARLQAVVDTMVDSVVTIDAAGTIHAVNAAAERLFGYAAGQMVGRNVNMLMPQVYADAHDGYLKRYRDTGVARIIGKGREVVAKRADGVQIPVDLAVSEFEVDGQRGFVGILRDITERKRAAAEQARLHALLAQIIDGDPVPTFVIDARHVVTHWNRACQKITGCAAAAVVGTPEHWRAFYDSKRPTLADLIVDGAHADDLLRFYKDKRLTRSPLIPGAFEAEDFFSRLSEGGSWLFFTAAPLTDGDGKVIGAIETLQDVTERRRAEEALVRHQTELELTVERRTGELADAHRQLMQSEKLASIGQLAAGVAHEINNPIGFVQSNIGSLERYFGSLLRVLEHFEKNEERVEGLGESGQNWVAEVRALCAEADYEYLKEDIPALLAESKDGIDRVRRIVQDLKDFSRPDTHQDWEWADLKAGLDSTLNIVHNEIKYRADVVKEYGPLPLVECQFSQLNQVFMNLLVNAAQAMPEGKYGRITIRCGSGAEEAWVEIADTGSGISKENLERIFDPFFTTKPVGKGTGLGLSLSYGIVKKHGGRIEVKSVQGEGTTFRVVLPVRQAPATP
ncbi:MAG: PAS domain S-box protein [Rhodocyclales bacterium]|nr:PAS domain S-box protein [Rhodocyclales bacterium]